MSPWFRFYADAYRHPKVARLSDKDYRLWTELMQVACERKGLIPPLDDLKHILKRRLDHLSSSVDRLISGGLIDALEHGYAPHGWDKRQYKSDTSTDRVKRHREKRNVSVTPPDTDTDTDTEKEERKSAGAPDYAFAGKVIRLTRPDYARWQKAYSRLDLMAELQSRDDWLSTQPEPDRKRWFNSTSSYLRSQQSKAPATSSVPL